MPPPASTSTAPLRIFFGQHKCASTWATLLLERICHELGWKCTVAYARMRAAYSDLQALIDHERPDILVIPESRVEMVGQVRTPFKGFHISRDPRDIIVSAYFSHRGSHALSEDGVTPEYRDLLRTLPKEQGLDHEIAHLGGIPLGCLQEWKYDDPRILELHFAHLTANPLLWFSRILVHLDMLGSHEPASFRMQCLYNRAVRKLHLLPLRIRARAYTEQQLARSLDDLSFARLQADRMAANGLDGSHYRSGKSGDWRNHLNARQAAVIEQLYPGLTAKMEALFQKEQHPA
jgi:hypothetical protein